MRRDASGRMLTWAQTPERGSLRTSWCTVAYTGGIAEDQELREVGEESDQYLQLPEISVRTDPNSLSTTFFI